MIETLALKHELWVKMARGICKDSYLADDLVSEMYLKLNDYNKPLNEYYVYFAIKSIYIEWLRSEKHYTSDEQLQNISVSYEDVEHIDVTLPNCLTWVEKQILILRQDKSLMDINKQYHIHYKKVGRIENKAKEKLRVWATQLQAQEI